METHVISQSGQLARPGAPLVEASTAPAFRPHATVVLPPTILAPEADRTRPNEIAQSREASWACEWWPPD
jgi:hypothetical protein